MDLESRHITINLTKYKMFKQINLMNIYSYCGFVWIIIIKHHQWDQNKGTCRVCCRLIVDNVVMIMCEDTFFSNFLPYAYIPRRSSSLKPILSKVGVTSTSSLVSNSTFLRSSDITRLPAILQSGDSTVSGKERQKNRSQAVETCRKSSMYICTIKNILLAWTHLQ